MKKVIISIVVVALAVLGYVVYANFYKQEIVFFVSNESEDLPNVNLEVSLGEDKLINEEFKYINVEPHHTTFFEKVRKGKSFIEVNSHGKIKIFARKEIELSDKPLYVFVSFHYDTLIGKELQSRREIFYMTHDSTAKFEPDSLLRRKDIVIHVMDKKPVHM
jgi:hypothetical protein